MSARRNVRNCDPVESYVIARHEVPRQSMETRY